MQGFVQSPEAFSPGRGHKRASATTGRIGDKREDSREEGEPAETDQDTVQSSHGRDSAAKVSEDSTVQDQHGVRDESANARTTVRNRVMAPHVLSGAELVREDRQTGLPQDGSPGTPGAAPRGDVGEVPAWPAHARFNQGHAKTEGLDASASPPGGAPFFSQPPSFTQLPPHWATAIDPSTGATYYYHERTGACSWKPPPSLPPFHSPSLPPSLPPSWDPSLGWRGHATTLCGPHLPPELRKLHAALEKVPLPLPDADSPPFPPLPAPEPSLDQTWVKLCEEGTGRAFYYNVVSQARQWEVPIGYQ
ncbi:hypothetical protein NGA_0477200, partial [Nannochloropsis gaditana CCMP526]|uniref:uncharacterized protein n=1 Tax=Nannochloropsis gaditana (strain CCMP526) TaxID=1093141 RepID=UPI00029F635F